MKKFIAIFMALAILTIFVGCGSDKTINGQLYTTHGLFNKDEASPNIRYKMIVGNVIWGVILFEMVWAPIYFFGFSMYEPVGVKLNLKSTKTPEATSLEETK